MDVVVADELARKHFGDARLGDLRRVRRLMKVAQHILQHPLGTLPQKMDDWAGLMGLYRLLAAEQVTHQALLEPHRQQTLVRMAEHEGVVLLLHDSSDLDFTHCRALHEELGQIGNGGGRGYIAHHTLAITPQRQVLGLVDQQLHRRRRVSKQETPTQKRAHPQRESLLWLSGCQATGAAPPPGCTWIDIADRGSDTFEFLSYAHATGRKYVIRSARNRTLAGADHVGSDRIHQKLHDYARDLPQLGTRTVEVSAQADRKGKKRRTAQVSVSGGPLTLAVPAFARGAHEERPLDLWVIHVREIDPPAGVEPLEWILLSNLPADSFERACQLIDFYTCRIVIEEYHKGQKTGLGIETLRFEQVDRLQPAIALLSVIAALLLQLRAAARDADADQRLARTIVPLIYVQVLSGKIHKQVRDDLSVRQFLLGVARLGGHLGRKHDGFPGWLTLWRGWNDLQLMVQGVLAFRGSG